MIAILLAGVMFSGVASGHLSSSAPWCDEKGEPAARCRCADWSGGPQCKISSKPRERICQDNPVIGRSCTEDNGKTWSRP